MNRRIITGIEQQKKNPNRVNIYLDEQFAFGLYKASALHLKVGDTLDDASIQALEQKDAAEEAYQKALKLLNIRPRTEHEMRSRLQEYGFTDEIIEPVIANLLEKNYLNDQQFAAEWIENRTTFRPRGKRLLRIELMKKHVDEEEIQTALAALPEEEKLVREAAKKYSNRLKGLDESTFKKRLYGFLVRRGFSYDDIKPILDEVWEENARLNSLENEVLKNE
ncbi:MAG: regulatory protein RecX [Anaerolineaceae bacterium]